MHLFADVNVVQNVNLIRSYLVPKMSVEELISKMACKVGMSFRQISDPVIVQLIQASYKNAPNSHVMVRKFIEGFADSIIQKYKNQLSESKKVSKFSIIFDEWTSLANKRYLNVVVTNNSYKIWNLGLAPIVESADSSNCLGIVEKKLEQFNLFLYDDVISVVTDGSAVMKKIGEIISPIHQQLCLAHAIQLAVLDVFYQKKNIKHTASKNKEEEETDEEEIEDEETDTESFNSNKSEDTNDIFDDEQSWQSMEEAICDSIGSANHLSDDQDFKIDPFSSLVDEFTENDEVFEINQDFGSLIINIRNIVKYFNKSPKNNETLQNYVKKKFDKPFKLILDCKTRWSSLHSMLERVAMLKRPLKRAIKATNCPHMLIDSEFDLLTSLTDSLGHLKAIVSALCLRDVNLIMADTALVSTFNFLIDQNTSLSEKIFDCLRIRVAQRRTILSDALHFLHFRNFNKNIHSILQTKPPTQSQLFKVFKDLVSNSKKDDLATFFNDSDQDLQDQPAKKLRKMSDTNDIYTMMFESMETEEEVPDQREISDVLRIEIELFLNKSPRGKHLEYIYQSLLTVRPTSVESERIFSSAGYICNKLRTKLNDETLDTISFLRSYFQTIKK